MNERAVMAGDRESWQATYGTWYLSSTNALVRFPTKGELLHWGIWCHSLQNSPGITWKAVLSSPPVPNKDHHPPHNTVKAILSRCDLIKTISTAQMAVSNSKSNSRNDVICCKRNSSLPRLNCGYSSDGLLPKWLMMPFLVPNIQPLAITLLGRPHWAMKS